MGSDLLLPYDFHTVDGLYYRFVNRDGIPYNVYFSPIYDVYPQFPATYSFSIEPEDSRPHSIDRRIAVTVVDILRKFFMREENAMIMICDSTDGKEHKRRMLFDYWFQLYNDGSISKVDASAETPDYNMYLSLYFRHDNPNKRQLIESFNKLMEGDLYEIII